MNNDFLTALKALNNDKGISIDYMLARIEKAIITACKNSYGTDEIEIDLKNENGLSVKIKKIVCEFVENPNNQITLEEAQLLDPDVNIGDEIMVDIDTKQFGRVAAQIARNVIRQGIKDNERDKIIENLKCSEGQVVSAKIVKIDKITGDLILKISDTETFLPKIELNGIENLVENDYLKVYVLRVFLNNNDEPSLAVSRSCNEIIKKMFELEVPEIADGSIEIKAIVREAGLRTKMAVSSNDLNVDPVGTCIGVRGSRIKEILKELGNEKIDIIKYYDEPEKFIESALLPAQILSTEIVPYDNTDKKACKVFVPKNQFSLAIGVRGQNVRLASKITGWKLEICSASD